MRLALAIAALAAGQATPPAPPPVTAPADPAVARMVALFDEVCLRTFPVAGAMDRLLDGWVAAGHAAALKPEAVAVTLKADPGHGWRVPDGTRDILIFEELPPYHACSVRRSVNAPADAAAYRTLADRYEAEHDGFRPIPTFDRDQGDVHVHGGGEGRTLPGGDTEALFAIDQHVTDPAKRAAGQTAVDLRFVHQIHAGR